MTKAMRKLESVGEGWLPVAPDSHSRGARGYPRTRETRSEWDPTLFRLLRRDLRMVTALRG